MYRYITFFIRTIGLSLVSFLQALLHRFYEVCVPNKFNSPNKKSRLLVVQLGQIGDFVLSEPLFSAIKSFYKEKIHLAVIVDQVNEGLAKVNSNIDEVIVYNSSKYTRATRTKDSTFPSLFLKEKHFDNVIWLRGDMKMFYFLASNRIPMISITKYSNPLRWSWLPLIIRRSVKKDFKHYIENLGSLCKEINTDLFIPDSNKALNMRLRKDSAKNIFIHIGAGSSLRKWPEENFSRLCLQLSEWNSDIKIKLLGSKADWEIAEGIKKNICLSKYLDGIENICGKIPLTKLSETLSGGDLFIGFDSGPMHIAALSGVPIVALMGPQSVQLFGPFGKQDMKVVYKHFFCSPCWQFSCLHVKSNPGVCVLAIKPNDVFEEVKAILEKEA